MTSGLCVLYGHGNFVLHMLWDPMHCLNTSMKYCSSPKGRMPWNTQGCHGVGTVVIRLSPHFFKSASRISPHSVGLKMRINPYPVPNTQPEETHIQYILLWWKFALLVKVQNIMFSNRFVLSNLRWALSLSPLQACGGLTGNNLVAKLWMGYIPHEPHLTYMGPRDSPTQVLVRKVFAWAFRIRTSWSHGFQKTIWNKYEIVPCWGPLAPHRKTESSLDELIDSSPISTVGQFGWLNFFQW
jgi:hypothetical protein